jgi:outer membrane protein OmpA-like peptidoglycan-associated protein
MRRLQLVAVATTSVMLASGCAVTKREWGTCTLGGAALGAIAGGITGGAVVNTVDDDKNDARRGGAIAGGIAGGALIGGLLGHLICDPLKEAPVVQAEAPPPPPPPPGTEIAELRGTHFAFDSAHLTAEGEAALDQTVATLREHGDLHVSIEGHTDSVGSDAYNQDLGQRRADAARQYLVDQGIDGSRLSAVSFGESRPVADNATADGRAENRRVEIIVE